MRLIVVDRELDDQARMRGFWRAGSPAIGNAELVRFARSGRHWTCNGSHTLTSPSIGASDTAEAA